MTPRRLESLADAVFAFAMTLLVLSINMPEAGSIDDISNFLTSQSQNFINFSVGFLLLALYWMSFSQQFHHIRKTDTAMVFLTFLILMFVVLVPFSTSLMNDYTDSVTAEAFFNSNLFVLTTLLSVNWVYVYRRDLLDKEHVATHIVQVGKREVLLPLIPLTAIALAFLVPGWSTVVYILIPVMQFAPIGKKKDQGAGTIR